MTLGLTVDGKTFTGWTQATFRDSLQTVCGSFSLIYLDRWAGREEIWPIRKNAPCTLTWNGTTVLTGFAENPSAVVDGESWQVGVEGRDAGLDIVDCDILHPTGVWRNKTAIAIIKDICAPFNLSVTANVPDTAPIDTFALRGVEPAFSAIDRLAKLLGALPKTTPDGKLELFSTNDYYDLPIVLDTDKAKYRSIQDSVSQRFSEYHVNVTGKGAISEAYATAVVKDEYIDRYRPKVLKARAGDGVEAAKRMAQWEASHRATQGQILMYTFQDPTDLRGRFYRKGALYQVDDSYFGVSATLILRDVHFELSGNSIGCTLVLVDPSGYSTNKQTEDQLLKRTKRRLNSETF